jgi:excisionase family DNA binding protein
MARHERNFGVCRGLSRAEAATYIGISATKFDELVEAGTMPKPKAIGKRRLWDRWLLDEAFDALPSIEEDNPWEAMTAG